MVSVVAGVAGCIRPHAVARASPGGQGPGDAEPERTGKHQGKAGSEPRADEARTRERHHPNTGAGAGSAQPCIGGLAPSSRLGSDCSVVQSRDARPLAPDPELAVPLNGHPEPRTHLEPPSSPEAMPPRFAPKLSVRARLTKMSLSVRVRWALPVARGATEARSQARGARRRIDEQARVAVHGHLQRAV